jgi:hypothetical protein
MTAPTSSTHGLTDAVWPVPPDQPTPTCSRGGRVSAKRRASMPLRQTQVRGFSERYRRASHSVEQMIPSVARMQSS